MVAKGGTAYSRMVGMTKVQIRVWCVEGVSGSGTVRMMSMLAMVRFDLQTGAAMVVVAVDELNHSKVNPGIG